MKIMINYDLLEKIEEAKIGFSIKKTTTKVVAFSALAASLVEILKNTTKIDIDGNMFDYFLTAIPQQLLWVGLPTTLIAIPTKHVAKYELDTLSVKLTSINIDTNKELLKKSYGYKTEYKLVKESSSIPKLEQKKYIMIPVYDHGVETELSLLQEHTIGTKQYSLSVGEPQKVLKLAYNSI